MPDKAAQVLVDAPTPHEPAEDASSHRFRLTSDTAFAHHNILMVFTFIWGGNFVLAEIALREMAPISFSVARFLMGGVAMLAILYLQVQRTAKASQGPVRLFPKVERRDWPRLLVVALFGATLAPWLGIEGLSLTHAGRASLWLALGPVVSAALGYLMRTEKVGRIGQVGIVLAGLGTFGLALDGLHPERGYWIGDVLLVLALVFSSCELHLIKPLASRYGATPMVAARTAMGGMLYVLVASPSLVEQTWLSLGLWTWVAILVGGAIGVGVGQWVKVRALRTLGPTRVVLYGNLVPLAALLLAWLILGTVPSTLELTAGVFIILGALCLQVLDAPRMRVPITDRRD